MLGLVLVLVLGLVLVFYDELLQALDLPCPSPGRVDFLFTDSRSYVPFRGRHGSVARLENEVEGCGATSCVQHGF